MAMLDAHLKAAAETRKISRAPVLGSRQAKDGHYYAADSKRPGKYLMVVHHG